MSAPLERMLAALDRGAGCAPITEGEPGFDLAASYRLAHELTAARMARGELPVGRKTGFTNTTIWPRYNVDGPVWGMVWDRTLHEGAGRLRLGHLCEPRIEPEIVLRLRAAPQPGANAAALADCVEAVALGFEIVQSPFPGWRFRAPDTVAAFGLHGALVTGPWAAADPDRLARLSDFSVVLERDGAQVDRGHAGNVLGGGPLRALDYLARAVAEDPGARPLMPGEVVSTGTLTDAWPVAPGQVWRAEAALPFLPPLTLALD